MFQLNPLSNPEAWWQLALMLIVAAILGYIIGYRTGQSVMATLRSRLARLDVDLEKCIKGLAVLSTSTANAIKDDLKIVEGIGPAIEKLMNNAGIYSFGQLSSTPVEVLRRILTDGGQRFLIHNPDTWPRQGAMAAEGKWDELKEWQAILAKGKE